MQQLVCDQNLDKHHKDTKPGNVLILDPKPYNICQNCSQDTNRPMNGCEK